jgi:hypothetical protein
MTDGKRVNKGKRGPYAVFLSETFNRGDNFPTEVKFANKFTNSPKLNMTNPTR